MMSSAPFAQAQRQGWVVVFKIYQDGELAADESKAAPLKIKKVSVAASGSRGGTAGAMAEYRIWDRERTADEIRAARDRSLPWNSVAGLLFTSAVLDDWGNLLDGAKVVKTSDFPPVHADEEPAAAKSRDP